MTIVLFPIIAILIGIGLWCVPNSPRVNEAGRLVFFAGVFWLVGGNAHAGQLTIR